MFSESDLLPISALQHVQFCPRQWGLIHLEQVWAENSLTMEGRIMHERVHEDESESRGDLRIARGLRIHSFRYGLVGQADVVEFHQEADALQNETVMLPNRPGHWRPFPVEYKRGKPKIDQCDEVQLCAQTLCLEEMLEVSIPAGAFFYGQPRRRHEVIFTVSLRKYTENLITQLHDLSKKGITPTTRYQKKCKNCSLLEQCRPEITGINKKVEQYILRNMSEES